MFIRVRPRVQALDLLSFSLFVGSADFALLKVKTALGLTIPDVIIDYFEGEYPGRFVYGALEQSSVPLPVWWRKHFGKIPQVLKKGVAVPGIYLFHLGKLEAYHPAKSEADPTDGEFLFKAAASLLSDIYLGTKIAPKAINEQFARGFEPTIKFIDGVVQRLASLPPPSRNKDGPDKRIPADPPPQGKPSPYERLGISPGVTNDEVKKAYREQIARNHPDKVDHMSEDFQQLAAEKTRHLNEAFEEIKRQRGGLDSGTPARQEHENGGTSTSNRNAGASGAEEDTPQGDCVESESAVSPSPSRRRKTRALATTEEKQPAKGGSGRSRKNR